MRRDMSEVNESKMKEVTMADGSTVAFNSKANKRAFTNPEEGTVTFALTTGVQHSLNVMEIPYLSDYFSYPDGVKKLIVEGLKSKISATVNNKAEDRVGEAILNAFNSFKTGVANRLVTYRRGLKLEELAYAETVVKFPKLSFLQDITKTMPWDDTSSHAVMVEVRKSWANLTKENRKVIRNSPQYLNCQSGILVKRAQEAEADLT
jgi:hypothetical protein